MTGPVGRARRWHQAVNGRWRSAPLRTRLTAAAAVSATLAIVAVVAVAYVAVRHEMRGNLDTQLHHQATEVHVERFIAATGLPVVQVSTRFGEVGGYLQAISPSGQYATRGPKLPISHADEQIAANGGTMLRDAYVSGVHVRILTKELKEAGPNVAVQIALPLTQIDRQLHKVAWAFVVLVLVGLGIAILGAWFVVRRTMRPVARLTGAAEQIAETRDLTTRIEDYGDDELGRLASTFNTMLDALERSLGQQRQLILDASHELRTPLASLRTNVEVLHDVDRLSLEQRRALLDGIVTQLDELTGLVADVVELARGDVPQSDHENVAWDDLLLHAVDRARRHWPNLVFMAEVEPLVVRGVPARLDRAVANLLDNAGKFSSPGGTVDVHLGADGVLTVADRGPGVPEDAIAHVFDRFYRADEARALPGSGLGLSIVKQVIEGHGGSVAIGNRDSGGAVVTVTLPPLPREEPARPEVDVVDEPEPARS